MINFSNVSYEIVVFCRSLAIGMVLRRLVIFVTFRRRMVRVTIHLPSLLLIIYLHLANIPTLENCASEPTTTAVSTAPVRRGIVLEKIYGTYKKQHPTIHQTVVQYSEFLVLSSTNSATDSERYVHLIFTLSTILLIMYTSTVCQLSSKFGLSSIGVEN